MNSPIVAGNWKMGIPNDPLSEYLSKIAKASAKFKGQVILFPHFLAINKLSKMCEKHANISVGAQNVNYNEGTSYTGEISSNILQSNGATYVLTGHSERRNFFHEKNSDVAKKNVVAIDHGLTPIVCVGEDFSQRKNNTDKHFIALEIEHAFSNYRSKEQSKKIVIAYEPIWAIGTGLIPSYDDINIVIEWIKKVIDEYCGNQASDDVLILYGGSVNSENVKGLLSNTKINGVLVGAASRDTEEFASIIKIASKI